MVLDRGELGCGIYPWRHWMGVLAPEGDAFPQRTIDLLSRVDAAIFGAITSKPVKAAEAELSPALQGKGLIYRSPIVRMSQLFDLYVCLRPCKAYAGNALNYKPGIDLVVFRENTEDLYAGVEFNPVPGTVRPCRESRSRSALSGPCRRRLCGLLQDQYPCRFGADRPGGLRVRS